MKNLTIAISAICVITSSADICRPVNARLPVRARAKAHDTAVQKGHAAVIITSGHV